MTLPVSSFWIRWKTVLWWDSPTAWSENKIHSEKKNKETEIVDGSSTSKEIKSSFNASPVLRCLDSYAYSGILLSGKGVSEASERASSWTKRASQVSTVKQSAVERVSKVSRVSGANEGTFWQTEWQVKNAVICDCKRALTQNENFMKLNTKLYETQYKTRTLWNSIFSVFLN